MKLGVKTTKLKAHEKAVQITKLLSKEEMEKIEIFGKTHGKNLQKLRHVDKN